MSNPTASWKGVSSDPTAGVPLMPKVIRCPRCGIGKKGNSAARHGLCRDCIDVLPVADRAEWRRAA